MLSITELVFLVLAAYRLTRLIVIDTIFDGPRDKIYDWLSPKGVVGDKLSYLISCTWCAGVWISLGVYWLYTREFDFIGIAAVAGGQGMLHALEPDDA